MLKKLNITLLIIVLIGGLFLGGIALYDKYVPLNSQTEGTVNGEVNFDE